MRIQGLTKEELVAKFSQQELIVEYNKLRQRRGLEPIVQFKDKGDVAGRLISLLSIKDVSINGRFRSGDPPDAEVQLEPVPPLQVTKRPGRVRWSDDCIIEVVSIRPPKKMTKRNPYAYYMNGKTVREVLESGHVSRRDLNWDEKSGTIKIHPPGTILN